ncbi:unnamed protein product [Moneuplotes crassus]|uniref:Hikeshi-like C-terminal domain-containing protein n=1 Tax=Euplotes crassus TaxID=5936 RepID=A0AAD2D767_EUPCR|nr:unnamed protein product [Moneuplotes crassus]
MFGILVPGRQNITEFENYEEYWYAEVENPAEINVLGLYINEPLQDESLALCLYVSKPPYDPDELEFVGAVANARPSDIFHTAWEINPTINIHSSVKLVIKGEPLESIKEMVEIKEDSHITKKYALQVAKHLYNYVESFNVPEAVFTKWYEKFSNKFKMDPNFIFNVD